jgi:transcription antitermination factor NusA-like protein
MKTKTFTTSSLLPKDKYLTPEQLDAKEKEFGSIWMAFFRFEDGKYICDGIKVDGKWIGKNSVFTTWRDADAYLRTNGIKVDYAVSPLDGQALAVNMGVIAVYLRKLHPTYADRLAKQVHLKSIRFARFNSDGTGFVGYNPEIPKMEKRTFKIEPSWGTTLIGEKGSNAQDFFKMTGTRFVVKGETLTVEGPSEKMELGEMEIKKRISAMIPTPSLCPEVKVAKSSLGGWASAASKEASASSHPPMEVIMPKTTTTTTTTSKETHQMFTLPEDVEIGKLIGPKGIHIRALKEFTEATLELMEDPLSGNSMIKISHPDEEKRTQAHDTVLAFLEYLNDSETTCCPIPIYQNDIDVSDKVVGLIIGAQGSNIKKLRQSTGCDIYFNKQEGYFRVSSFLKNMMNSGYSTVLREVQLAEAKLASSVPSKTQKQEEKKTKTSSVFQQMGDDE